MQLTINQSGSLGGKRKGRIRSGRCGDIGRLRVGGIGRLFPRRRGWIWRSDGTSCQVSSWVGDGRRQVRGEFSKWKFGVFGQRATQRSSMFTEISSKASRREYPAICRDNVPPNILRRLVYIHVLLQNL